MPEDLKERAFALLVDNVEGRGRRLSTGFSGTRYLLEVLCDHGRDDLAYAIATAEEYPGWGHMRKHQATTLWEHWDLRTGQAMNSHNHPSLASVGGWFMKYLAGIRPDEHRPGFQHVVFAPFFPPGLNSAAGRQQTVRGLASSSWHRCRGKIELDLAVPSGCSAELRLPGCIQSASFGEPAECLILNNLKPIALPEGETAWKILLTDKSPL